MDDKRYNVWTIIDKDGKLYNRKYIIDDSRTVSKMPRMKFVGIVWEDNIHKASWFNYHNAQIEMDKLDIEGLSIIGYEEYEALNKKKP